MRVLVCALLALLTPFARAQTIQDDLAEFCALLPHDAIKKIADDHIANDDAFNAAVATLQGERWARKVERLRADADWKKLKAFLSVNGVDLNHAFDAIFKFVATLQPRETNTTAPSLRAFLDDVETALPIGKMLQLVYEKKRGSDVFARFHRALSSDESRALVEASRRSNASRDVTDELARMGFRVDEALRLFYALMGWPTPRDAGRKKRDAGAAPSPTPLAILRDLTDSFYDDDGKFRDAVDYLYGAEFRGLLERFRSRPEWQKLRDELQSRSHVDPEAIFECFADLLHKLHATADRRNLDAFFERNGGATTLAAMNCTTPQDADYDAFYATLRSRRVAEMADAIRDLPEFAAVADKLEEVGVRFRRALMTFYSYVMWSESAQEPAR